MRIRHKPWAKPELEACPFYISEPKLNRGHWNTIFPGEKKPLRLELGCGKGGFISQEAPANPDYHYIAMDIKNDMLVLAKRKLEAAYAEQQLPLDNVRIFICNLMQFSEYFSPEDRIDRIYINFCNPWPRGKHRKKRLTHTRQLEKYKEFLSENAEIYFKTDDDELFEASLTYFEESGFKIMKKTYNLHEEPIFEKNIETEHEKMFSEQGIKIKALIAKIEK